MSLNLDYLKTMLNGIQVKIKKYVDDIKIEMKENAPDWSQNDPNGKGYIKNRSLDIVNTTEVGTWSSDYSELTCDYSLSNNRDLILKINDLIFRDLPYTSGSYGAFTYGDLDTVGIKLSNPGYGRNTYSLSVSEIKFPNGVTSAHIYIPLKEKLPIEALPVEAAWVASTKESDLVKTYNANYVKTMSSFKVLSISDTKIYEQPSEGAAWKFIMKQYASENSHNSSETSFKFVPINESQLNAVTKPLLHPDTGLQVTTAELPRAISLIGVSYKKNLYLLNPRRTIAAKITASSTNHEYAGAKAVYDLVNNSSHDALYLNSSTADSTKKFKITVDDSGTLTATEITSET